MFLITSNKKILIQNLSISAECVEVSSDKMIPEARALAKINPNIVIKIPLTTEGLKTVRVISQDDIQTNVTLCFSGAQGLLAAKAGATYLSPFIGRLDDISSVGMTLINELVTIFDTHLFGTQVLAASIRSPRQVVDVALAGAHAATIPFKVLKQLVEHPLTTHGLEKFLADWEQVPK